MPASQAPAAGQQAAAGVPDEAAPGSAPAAGTPSATPGGTPRSATTMSAATEASPAASSGGKMQAASSVEPAGPSALVGWGICLVAVSLGAGAIVLRMRRI